MRLPRHRNGRGRVGIWLLAGLAWLAAAVPSASAGIIAANEPNGWCEVVASIDGVAPWELRLERLRDGDWVTVRRPFRWDGPRATFRCSGIARARIRARATTAGSPDRPVTAEIRQPKPIVPQVRMLYVRPRDRVARDDFAAAIGNAGRVVQQWYAAQLGRSFRLSPRGVERCTLPHDADHYALRTLTRVLRDVQPCRAVGFNSPGYAWLVYVDVDHACNRRDPLGVGAKGLAILPRDDLDGLVGELGTSDCGVPLTGGVGRWIGGAAHELGHAFGMSHPAACNRGLPTCDFAALMFAGYVSFPDTYLRAPERAFLSRSPFFTRAWAAFGRSEKGSAS